MRTDHTVTLKELSVGYNGKALIRDISLRIGGGGIVSLIGPNGAGKSTILKSITRQLAAVAGSVCIGEKDLTDLSHRDLSLSMAVMLTERIRPELMSCFDVAATGRYPYTGKFGILSSEDERIVTDALRTVHADGFAGADFTEVSDGQKQLVLLARAIAQEPEIIVLDEPTSYLDIKHKIDLLNVLRKMASERGVTVILSLHEIDLALKVSDHVLCVKGETVYRYDTPEALIAEDAVCGLYDLTKGQYDMRTGNVDLDVSDDGGTESPGTDSLPGSVEEAPDLRSAGLLSPSHPERNLTPGIPVSAGRKEEEHLKPSYTDGNRSPEAPDYAGREKKDRLHEAGEFSYRFFRNEDCI